jgi:uncharacterized protein
MSDWIAPGTSDCQGQLHPQAIHGMELFNQGRYFEAHEALEAAWRAESGPVRDLYRGILQVGVVYLHISNRNYAGALKVYQRCRKWLLLWPATCRGVQVGRLWQDLETVIATLQALGPEHILSFDTSLLKPIHYRESVES